MNIVIPMAGRGSRFADAGYTLPKPLIPVRGRPMYAWAVDSLPLELARRVVFVCLEEHLRDRALADDIHARYSGLNPQIVGLDHVTEGQACTVLMARDLIDNDEGLLIYNADTYARSGLASMLPALPDDVAGVLTVFEAAGDKWSFARVDDEGQVLETAEKRRISSWASTGLYYFRRGADFARHADAMVAEGDRVNNEFYVAPIYNRMIAEGRRVMADFADEVWVLGTPEDLDCFNQHYRG